MFTYSSTLTCPECSRVVQVGTAGHKNLDAHRASKACRKLASRVMNRQEKPSQSIDTFFKPRAALNPSSVSAPPPIRPGKPFMLTPECPLSDSEHLQACPQVPTCPMTVSSGGLAVHATTPQRGSTVGKLPVRHVLDQKAVSLLQELEVAVKRIPGDTPSATPGHRLNIFAVEPRTCVAKPGEDDWFSLNQMMKSSFGWGESEMAAVVPQLLNQGTYGLDGFIHFLTYFVQERGLQGALFETKVEAILKEIDNR